MTELERFVRQGYRVLLLTSYCGDDGSDCTDAFPCDDCLKMCNVVEIRYDGVEVLGGLDYLKGREANLRVFSGMKVMKI